MRLPVAGRGTLLRAIPFFALILIAAMLSYRYHLLLLTQRNQIEHTYQVLTTLETMLVRVIDAETGQRGFVITGDDLYLAPYHRALDDIPALNAQLRGLIDDHPLQVRRAGELEARVDAKLAELRETVQTRQQRGLEAARAVVVRDRGRFEMDAVRATIGEMRGTEAELLVERSAQARETERWLLAVTLVCALLSVAARAGLALMAARSRARSSSSGASADGAR